MMKYWPVVSVATLTSDISRKYTTISAIMQVLSIEFLKSIIFWTLKFFKILHTENLKGVKSFAIFWYMLVCGTYIMWPKQFKLWERLDMDGSFMKIGALTHRTLFHSMYDLIAAQMIVQCNLIQELILYKSKLGHITPQRQPKTFVLWKVEEQLFKKFCLGCKNLDNKATEMPYTMDSKAILQAIEANPVSSTQRVSGKLRISQSSVVHHLHDLSKSIWSCWIMLHISKILQTFDSL